MSSLDKNVPRSASIEMSPLVIAPGSGRRPAHLTARAVRHLNWELVKNPLKNPLKQDAQDAFEGLREGMGRPGGGEC